MGGDGSFTAKHVHSGLGYQGRRGPLAARPTAPREGEAAKDSARGLRGEGASGAGQRPALGIRTQSCIQASQRRPVKGVPEHFLEYVISIKINTILPVPSKLVIITPLTKKIVIEHNSSYLLSR